MGQNRRFDGIPDLSHEESSLEKLQNGNRPILWGRGDRGMEEKSMNPWETEKIQKVPKPRIRENDWIFCAY